MRRFHMPPQIVRLVLLTIAIVGSYLVARTFLTPSSFGQYGHYRGDALEELSRRDRQFGGRKSCEECHSDVVKKLSLAEHKGLSCEGCHGPGQAHVDNPDVDMAPSKSHPDLFGACVRCHEANPSRPRFLKQIVVRQHYPGQKCTECHVAHQPLEVP